MEEVRAAAMAYYKNLSEEQKRLALNLFNALDANEDGAVTLREFLDYLGEAGHAEAGRLADIFKELDSNGDGTLDFEEVITLFYMCRGSRMVYCDGCGAFLKGLYFTCVHCFSNAASARTYDLCCWCYRRQNYVHPHSEFLDNYALLRCLKPSPSSSTTAHMEQQACATAGRSKSKSEGVEVALKFFEVASDIGNFAVNVAGAGACSIM